MVSEPWHRNKPVLPQCIVDFLDGVRMYAAKASDLMAPGQGDQVRRAELAIVDELRHLSPGQCCFFVQRLADAMEDSWQEGG